MDAIEERLKRIEKNVRKWRVVAYLLCTFIGLYVAFYGYDVYLHHVEVQTIVQSFNASDEQWREMTESIQKSFELKVNADGALTTDALMIEPTPVPSEEYREHLYKP